MEFLDTSDLTDGTIRLALDRVCEADPVRGWVPAYHFRICDLDGNAMGKCDLRVGYTKGLYYGGHIGYAVDPPYRGHHYAARACRLLFGLARRHGMEYLYIGCDPDNLPSRRTLEGLGGELIEIAPLPPDNDMRKDGMAHTCVFRFVL